MVVTFPGVVMERQTWQLDLSMVKTEGESSVERG